MMTNFDFISKKDAPRLKNAAEKPFLSAKNLQVLEFENAVIAPKINGGVWQNGAQLPQTWLHWRADSPAPDEILPESLQWWISDSQKTPPEIVEKSEETVVFIGLFSEIWDHEITDNLKHLWFYFEEKYAHLKALPLCFAILWENREVAQNFWQFLEFLKIPKSQIRQITRPTQFAKIYVPDECFFYDPKIGACRYTKEFLRFFDFQNRALPAPKMKAEKIYFSRTNFKSQKDFNEIKIENLFKNQGFTIIHPEHFSFLEQLCLLQNCAVFAATEGSISHNLLFCKNEITAIICRKSRHFTEHQMAINAAKNARVFYVDCGFSPRADFKKDWWSGPFFLYETNALRRFFKLRPKIFPVFQFLKFLFDFKRKWFSWKYLKNKYFRFLK